MSEKMPSSANPEQEQSTGEQRTDEEDRSLGKKFLDFIRRFRKKQKYEAETETEAEAETEPEPEAETEPEAEPEPTIILEKDADTKSDTISNTNSAIEQDLQTSRLEVKQEANLDGLDDAIQSEESLGDSPEIQAAKKELIRSFEEWQETLRSMAEKGTVTPDDEYELKIKRDAITLAQIVYVSTLLPLQAQGDYMSKFYINPEDEGAEIVDYRKSSFIAPYLMDAASGRLDSEELQDAILEDDSIYDYNEQEREEIMEEFEPFFELLVERSKKK